MARPFPFGKNKYRNKPTLFNGVRYASKAEANEAKNIDFFQRNGQIRGWTRQVAFCLGVPENRYVVDFLVFRNDGTAYVVDVKGFRTQKFNRDLKLWRAYGPCPLLIVGKRGAREWITPDGFATDKEGGSKGVGL